MNDIILAPALQDFSYFQHKLPLYLQKSYGYIEHFRLWFNILIDLVNNADDIYDALDIFREDYPAGDATEPDNKILDMIGRLYGVTRYVNIGSTQGIRLTNAQFLLYLRALAAKNFCDGSAQSLQENYERCGLNIKMINRTPAKCTLVLDNTNEQYDTTIQGMFTSGLLTFASLGITYAYVIY